MADGELVLSIKNPGRPTAEDFRLALPPSATVRELKEALQTRYPGNPAPATVTVSRGEPASQAGGAAAAAAANSLQPYCCAAGQAPVPPPASAPLLQAIYAGRVLKDDNAVLSTFIVPVRRGPAAIPSLVQAKPLHPTCPSSKSPLPLSQCRTRTPRCRSRCTS